MSDYFEYLSIVRYALIIAPVLAATFALLSVFVVLRGMAMISEGVAHSGIGGLGLALLLGAMVPLIDNPVGELIITGIFCTAAALAIGYVSKGKHVSEDSAIGIFLTASVSIGIVALSLRLSMQHGRTPVSLEDMLFGAITTVTLQDVYVSLGICAAIFAVIFSMYRAFVYTALDEEMARINGVPVNLINLLMLLMVSVVIVIAIRMVGLFTVNALMIIPGATARLTSRSFGRVLLTSLVVGIGGVTGSLFLAVGLALHPVTEKIPTGPIMVLTLFVIFMITWAIKRIFKPKVVAGAKPVAAMAHAGHSH